MNFKALKTVLKNESVVIFLDDLCHWLEINALRMPDIITDPGKAITAEEWKELLTKWMNEDNGD